MEKLGKIVSFLNDFYRVAEIEDESCNGLQVSGKQDVKKIVCMLDASQEGIEKAIAADADMIIVHHGLFWGGVKSLTGIMYDRVRLLIKNDISLYGLHLPLDMHPEIGNNRAILNKLGLDTEKAFGNYHGLEIGLLAKTNCSRDDLIQNVKETISGEIRTALFGPEKIKRIAVVSGGGADLLLDAKRSNADTLLTGESKLHVYHLAKELGMNLIYAGHYATECLGIQLLSQFLPTRLSVNAEFLDVPTIF